MPIYEYKCSGCGLRFEYLCRSAGEHIVCPKCRDADLEKLVSAFSFNSKDSSGNTAAGSSSCSGCTSSSCASCAR